MTTTTTTFSLEIAREKVAAGAAFLDKSGPEQWRSRVWISKLRLADTEKCILGQLYGFYWTAVETLNLTRGQQSELGFIYWGDDEHFRNDETAWDNLHTAWVEELTRNA